jgi:dihydrodipicolinate synthase/N-acetylneuraminate lyase
MKTTAVTRSDLLASVISVPPLALDTDLRPSLAENRKIVDWMTAGGVSTYLYGGNANLYNQSVGEFGDLLDMLEEIAPADGWMIPSIGADYGKAMDQVAILKGRDFPTAMVLPLMFPATPAGIATGIRKLSDAYGKPLVAYIKSEGFIEPKDLASLLADGVVCSVKYAAVRENPSDDPYLRSLVDAAGTELIVSGIGERPAVVHLQEFGLTGFTSGSVCIAPQLSTNLLKLLQDGKPEEAEELRQVFLPLEDLRDGISPLRVLHAAVEGAGIAETGPMGPFLSAIEDNGQLKAIAQAASELRRLEIQARG